MRALLGLAVASALGGIGAGAAETALAPAAPPAAVRVGAKAPDFTLAASDGTARRLADLAGKQSLVLVFFRGVW